MNNLPATAPVTLISTALKVTDVQSQIAFIQDHMRQNLREGEHYGRIPGCGPKPALFKAGAEKLALIFQFAPKFEVKVLDMEKGHREYTATCILTHRPTDTFVANGDGSCSTMETKYNKGTPANFYNTCLKMAEKRAFVAAILFGTAASDIFTQDVEEVPVVVAETFPGAEVEPDPRDNMNHGGVRQAVKDTSSMASEKQMNFFAKLLKKHHLDPGLEVEVVKALCKSTELTKKNVSVALDLLSNADTLPDALRHLGEEENLDDSGQLSFKDDIIPF